MTSEVLGYRVLFSEDNDSGQVVVCVEAQDLTGQCRWVGDHTFEAWQDWSDVSAWVWNQLRLDMPVGVR